MVDALEKVQGSYLRQRLDRDQWPKELAAVTLLCELLEKTGGGITIGLVSDSFPVPASIGGAAAAVAKKSSGLSR
jgi:hypothetical protein